MKSQNLKLQKASEAPGSQRPAAALARKEPYRSALALTAMSPLLSHFPHNSDDEFKLRLLPPTTPGSGETRFVPQAARTAA